MKASLVLLVVAVAVVSAQLMTPAQEDQTALQEQLGVFKQFGMPIPDTLIQDYEARKKREFHTLPNGAIDPYDPYADPDIDDFIDDLFESEALDDDPNCDFTDDMNDDLEELMLLYLGNYKKTTPLRGDSGADDADSGADGAHDAVKAAVSAHADKRVDCKRKRCKKCRRKCENTCVARCSKSDGPQDVCTAKCGTRCNGACKSRCQWRPVQRVRSKPCNCGCGADPLADNNAAPAPEQHTEPAVNPHFVQAAALAAARDAAAKGKDSAVLHLPPDQLAAIQARMTNGDNSIVLNRPFVAMINPVMTSVEPAQHTAPKPEAEAPKAEEPKAEEPKAE